MSATYSFCSILPSTSTQATRCLPRHHQFLVRRAKPLSSTRLRVVKELIEGGTNEKVEIKTDGVALEPREEKGLLDLGKVEEESKEKKPKKKKVEDEATGEDRFKFQNGKEVLGEKSYLVGVECKGNDEDIFGIEDSLKELEQLADTAGLTVVGSTYQK